MTSGRLRNGRFAPVFMLVLLVLLVSSSGCEEDTAAQEQARQEQRELRREKRQADETARALTVKKAERDRPIQDAIDEAKHALVGASAATRSERPAHLRAATAGLTVAARLGASAERLGALRLELERYRRIGRLEDLEERLGRLPSKLATAGDRKDGVVQSELGAIEKALPELDDLPAAVDVRRRVTAARKHWALLRAQRALEAEERWKEIRDNLIVIPATSPFYSIAAAQADKALGHLIAAWQDEAATAVTDGKIELARKTLRRVLKAAPSNAEAALALADLEGLKAAPSPPLPGFRGGFRLYEMRAFVAAARHMEAIAADETHQPRHRRRADRLAATIHSYASAFTKAMEAARAYRPASAIPLLQKARGLDAKVNGAFASVLRGEMARMYAFQAASAYSSLRYATAAEAARKALALVPGESSARLIHSRVEQKVEGLLKAGRAAGKMGRVRAAERHLLLVLSIVPATDPRHREATRLIAEGKDGDPRRK